MKAIVFDRKWNDHKISHYIIRDSEGNEHTLTQDELKTAIRNNELQMINLTLRKDNKLSPFRKTLNYKIRRDTDDIKELNMFNSSNIIITYMNFGKIEELEDYPKEYILNDFDLQVLVRYGITLNIRFDKILVKLESDNHYFGVKFEEEIINNFIKNYIDQVRGTARFDDIRRLMNHIVNIPSIVEDIKKRKAEIDELNPYAKQIKRQENKENGIFNEIKIKVEAHNCNIHLNSMDIDITKGMVELPSGKTVEDCCRIIAKFINETDLGNYMSPTDFNDMGPQGKLGKNIQWFMSNAKNISAKHVMFRSSTYTIPMKLQENEDRGSEVKTLRRKAWFRVFCEVR